MDFKRAVEEVAARYRREGYQVIKPAGAEDLPAFANGYDVDLLAVKNGERVLVKVEVSREDLRHDPQLVQMADAVKTQPGWRFDLVVLNPEGRLHDLPPGTSEPSAESILRDLESAERLAKAGYLRASGVLSWAALEAAMRQAARAAGLEVQTVAPSFLLRLLYSEGLLGREDFDRLNDALKVRNALVHGFTLPSTDPAFPGSISVVARKLLAHNGQEQPS